MKKIKGIFGCIMAFVYALLIQIMIFGIFLFVFSIIKVISLMKHGITSQTELINIIESTFNGDMLLMLQSVASIVCAVIFVLWYYKKLVMKNKPGIKKVFEGRTILWIIMLSTGMQLGIIIILNLLIPVLPSLFESYGEHMELLVTENSLLSFIYIGLIAPISEEFIFRGVILNKGKKVISFMSANILQSILFGIMHMNIIQGIYAFFLGLVLGMLYERRQSILAPIALHMGFNILGILYGFIPVSFFETYKFFLIILFIIPIPFIILSIMKLNKNPVIIETDDIYIEGMGM